MSAENSRINRYIGPLSALRTALTRIRQLQRSRLVTLDERLEQEGLTPHMARDVGLSDASLINDSRQADR